MIALHWGVCHDDPAARQWAEQATHDAVIESIRQVGRRTSGILWRHYKPGPARQVLEAAVRAGVCSSEHRDSLLAALDEFAPAVLVTAEAEYEPAQRWQA
jgi:hypothetical protein